MIVPPNRTAARAHICFLTGDDNPSMEWQVFDDSKKRPDLARRYYARLDDIADALTAKQQAGCGVYIAVNQTDGTSRRRESVTAYRAIFLDLDGVPLPTWWAIDPGLIVRSSPRKYQVWWRLHPGADFEAWTALQLDLVQRYGADPKCALVTQVGRCAGFMHLKDWANPHEVLILEGPRGEPISLGDFAAAFGINLAESKLHHQHRLEPARAEDGEPPHGWDGEADIATARAFLADESNWKSTSDGGVSVYRAALQMHDLSISPDMAEELIGESIPTIGEDWDEHYIARKIEHAYKYARGEVGQHSAALRELQAREDRDAFMADEISASVIEGLRADCLKRVGRRRRIKVPLDFSTEVANEPLDFSTEAADEPLDFSTEVVNKPLDFSDTDENQS